jgi:hypothetical protein
LKQVRRPPSTDLLATSYDNLDSYTLVEHEGLQGMDRAVTTSHLPLNRGKGQCIHLSLHTQAPRLRIQKLPKFPRVPDPTDRQVKNLGTPNGTMNQHLNFALILII